MMKDSMFETLEIVRYAEQIYDNKNLGQFMEHFNMFLHEKDKKLADAIQRELFKVCTIVTLR